MRFNLPKYEKFVKHFINQNAFIIFLLISAVGLYLRFHNIEYTQYFGWDQARDAWTVSDMFKGQFTLAGPRTGIGHMHLGPLYYYFLAPFFYLTNLDPMGSNYFNFIANIINFALLFGVTRKIYNNYAALFVVLIYSFSHYLIIINRVPWNVTLMPGIAALIFYSIVKIYDGKYKWVFALWTLSGFYFNLHYTALFLPIINIASLAFVRDKKKVIKYSLLSIPLYLIWFVPTFIYQFQTSSESNSLNDFFKYYLIRFHPRFFLTQRLPLALIQFETIIFVKPFAAILKFIVPLLLTISLFFEKDRKMFILGYLMILWFLVPLAGFTFYGGPMSEYYFLYTVPMVLFIFYYLQKKVLDIKRIKYFALIIFIAIWSFYIYQNTNDLLVTPTAGGLAGSKQNVRETIIRGEKIEFNEGDINAYLYAIWTRKQK